MDVDNEQNQAKSIPLFCIDKSGVERDLTFLRKGEKSFENPSQVFNILYF
jgi:hypothetical protein